MFSKLFYRFFTYSAVILVFSAIFSGVKGGVPSLLFLALILAVINTFLRPLFSLLALPFNLVTFGIAGVFVNMITLVIADGISGGARIHGFLLKIFLSIAIILADGFVRNVRKHNK